MNFNNISYLITYIQHIIWKYNQNAIEVFMFSIPSLANPVCI